MSSTEISIQGGDERDLAMAALALQLDMALDLLAKAGVPNAKTGVQALGVFQVRMVADQLRALSKATTQILEVESPSRCPTCKGRGRVPDTVCVGYTIACPDCGARGIRT